MPTVRTTCPTCDTVIVEARAMTLRRRPEAAHAECTFLCPDCVTPVVQALSDRMVPVLIGAGCIVEDEQGHVLTAQELHPSMAGRITETEIGAFIADMERDDWIAELLT